MKYHPSGQKDSSVEINSHADYKPKRQSRLEVTENTRSGEMKSVGGYLMFGIGSIALCMVIIFSFDRSDGIFLMISAFGAGIVACIVDSTKKSAIILNRIVDQHRD